MKKIILFTTIFFTFFSIQCVGAENVKGKIISNLDKKLKIAHGDNAIISLGSNHGLIKGDIVTIVKPSDVYLSDPVGQCAVRKTFDSISACEIINMKQEIEIGQIVFINKLEFHDPNLFPYIFKVLKNLVDSYEAYDDITVYINNIFDANGNITKFSELIRNEIKFIFSQKVRTWDYEKKRIKFVEDDIGRVFNAYLPDELIEKNKIIEGFMKKDKIDAVIAGKYEIKDDKIITTFNKIRLYQEKIDKDKGKNNWKWDIATYQGSINKAFYVDLLSVVTVPYTSMKKEQNVICNFVFKPVKHMPRKNEKLEYITSAAQNDPFLLYNMGKVDFNIVSPHEFTIQIDNDDPLSFEKQNEYRVFLKTGKHEITASFKTGFYFNETLMFASPNECKGCKKTVILQMDKDAEVNIEVTADPLYGRESLDFNVYTKVVSSKPVLKPISVMEKIVPVETYKD